MGALGLGAALFAPADKAGYASCTKFLAMALASTQLLVETTIT
ncbi:hypothetical protein Ptr902_01253 [Pyrenophora tritici-repentis]|nr:hypothetical protein Ptr902_01253 [Pyrenophora tritici-repentis]